MARIVTEHPGEELLDELDEGQWSMNLPTIEHVPPSTQLTMTLYSLPQGMEPPAVDEKLSVSVHIPLATVATCPPGPVDDQTTCVP
jgi:hypothetical protein